MSASVLMRGLSFAPAFLMRCQVVLDSPPGIWSASARQVLPANRFRSFAATSALCAIQSVCCRRTGRKWKDPRALQSTIRLREWPDDWMVIPLRLVLFMVLL